MCEQCLAKTVLYVAPKVLPCGSKARDNKESEVLPGYFLVQATQDGDWMEKGDWGLVRSNDPDFVWTETPLVDPFDGKTDEEIDAIEKNKDNTKKLKAFDAAVESLEEGLNEGLFDSSYVLGKAMRKAGYNPKEHGYRSAAWLCNYLAIFLKTAKQEK